jgi:hypothetical protein
MKKIGIFCLMMVLMVYSAVAVTTGFVGQKEINTNGKWAWYDGGWHPDIVTTANFKMQWSSPNALYASFSEIETHPGDWKTQYQSNLLVSESGFVQSLWDIKTVNDPATTPSTGGYTAYSIYQMNGAGNSDSKLSISGNGWAEIQTLFISETNLHQITQYVINP